MSKIKVTFNHHFWIVTGCVVAVFAVGALSNHLWHNQVVHNRAVAATNAAVAADKKRRQATAVAEERKNLRTECDKEVQYYNSLTALQKKNQPAPACQALLAQ